MFTHADLICGVASSEMIGIAHSGFSAHTAGGMSASPGRQKHRSSARSTIHQTVQEAQFRWLDRVVQETELSLSEVARRSGLNVGTLTRFRNDKSGKVSLLNVGTVNAIASTTGVPLSPEIVGETSTAGLREREAEPYVVPDGSTGIVPTIRAAIDGRDHVHPWLLRSRALEHLGYRPGDVLIVDLTAAPEAGDIVCAQLYDMQAGRAETAFRLYEPPFLLASGPDDASRRPRMIGDGSAAIMGVVLTSIRTRGSQAQR